MQGLPGMVIGVLLSLVVGCQNVADEQEATQPPKASLPLQGGEIEINNVPEKREETPRVVEHSDADFQAGTVGDVKLLRIFADAFEGLPASKRLLAYYLSRAILLGQDITFDQVHREGLEVRRLVETILRQHIEIKPIVEAHVLTYLQLLTIHGGFYDRITFKKFLPPFTVEQFEQAAKAAYAAGADIGLAVGEPLEAKLSRLRKIMFDPAYEPMQGGIVSAQNNELLLASNTNLYEGVTLRALAGFKERYPSNSRLIRVDDTLVEEVYRTGDNRRKIPPGRYAKELKRVNSRLQSAITIAPSHERKILSLLVEHFRTGDGTTFDEALRGWSELPLPIEFILGFLDVRLDPRKVKGIFSGLLGYEDREATAKLAALLSHAQALEERMPWGAEFVRTEKIKPVAVAVAVLTAAGRQWPLTEFSLRVWPRDEYGVANGYKVLVATNVIEAYRRAVIQPLIREFVEPAAQAKTTAQAPDLFFWRVVLRDVLGPNMGWVEPTVLMRFRNLIEPLDALKAELVALWLLPDETLLEAGLISSREAGFASYNMVVAQLFQAEASNHTELRAPSALASRMLLRYLVEKAQVVKVEEQNKKLYPIIKNPEAFHTAVGKLLVRIQRILASGKRRSALKFLAEFSDPPTWASFDNVAERAKTVGLRRLVAYVTPTILPIRGADNKVIDATLSSYEPFERQIISYDP